MNKRKLHELTITENDAINFAIEIGLLKNFEPMNCINPICNGIMNFESGKIRQKINGRFRCSKRNCRKSISVTKNSIFESNHISFKNFFDVLYCYCERKTIEESITESGLCKKTVCFWRKKFDNIIVECGSIFVSAKLGGIEKTVEIDESLLFKRKSHMGRILLGQRIWVIGAIERESKSIRIKLGGRRRAIDCEQFIVEKIESNSVVITDCWRGYLNISSLGYFHRTVNHSLNFVN